MAPSPERAVVAIAPAPAPPPPGVHEAIARGVAQSLIYCLETVKTHQQIYGAMPAMSLAKWLDHIGRGMLSSVVSSGVVFGGYYAVYDRVNATAFAALSGPISTVATSVVKIPMGNSMRLLQAGIGRNIVDSGARLIRKKGVRGLYGGYALSVAEDTIEWDARERLYQMLKGHPALGALGLPPATAGVVLGALTGMFAAGITTPFDTLRARIAYRNAAVGAVATAATAANLFAGAPYRMLSSGVKSGLFYAILETIRAPPSRRRPARAFGKTSAVRLASLLPPMSL